MVEGSGFEPLKSKQQIYSLPPLAAREPLQNWKPHILLDSPLTVNKKRPKSCLSHTFREQGLGRFCMQRQPQPRLFKYGAGTMNRTRDLLITSQLLYQLSYAGKYNVTTAIPGKASDFIEIPALPS